MPTTCHEIAPDAVISEISFKRLRQDIGTRAGFHVNQAARGNRYHDDILTKKGAKIRYLEKRMQVTFLEDEYTWIDNQLVLHQELPASVIASLKSRRLGDIVEGAVNEDQKIVRAEAKDGKSYLTIEDRDLAISSLPEGEDKSRAMIHNGLKDFMNLFDPRGRTAR